MIRWSLTVYFAEAHLEGRLLVEGPRDHPTERLVFPGAERLDPAADRVQIVLTFTACGGD
jgi:hypothetical protein